MHKPDSKYREQDYELKKDSKRYLTYKTYKNYI